MYVANAEEFEKGAEELERAEELEIAVKIQISVKNKKLRIASKL